MVKNKKKGAKKGKGGQPKKPAIQAFDLEFINKNDLKKYVTLLEKELSLMRKDCAFYSANKEKIMEFLESGRNVLTAQNEMSVIRKSEKDEIVEMMRRFPEKYNEKLLLADSERVRIRLKNLLNDFVVRSTTEANHFDEEQFLKKQIADKDKRIEFYQFLSEMTMMDLKESYQNSQEDIDLKYSKKIEAVLQQNISRSLRANQEFSSNKTRMLISVWDIPDQHHRESYINEMIRLQGFFHEISSNNNEVIKMLRERLSSSLTELKKVSLSLKQVMAENMKLQVVQPPCYLPIGSCNAPVKVSHGVINSQTEKNFENLKFRNEILREQLRMEKEKFQNLKEQLIDAARKTFQKAAFKAHMLEEIIKLNLQMETMSKEKKDPGIQKHDRVVSNQKPEKKDGLVNVFSIRVESADTLFVPPHYHEFWDPSIKLIDRILRKRL